MQALGYSIQCKKKKKRNEIEKIFSKNISWLGTQKVEIFESRNKWSVVKYVVSLPMFLTSHGVGHPFMGETRDPRWSEAKGHH